MDTAVDGLGQEIFVGDKVIWLSGIGKYGGVKIFVVRGITRCKVALSEAEFFKRNPDCGVTYADHKVVVVVNKIINDPSERDE